METDNQDVIYEVKKEIEINKIMQLIDLNGTKKNFQSDFIFQLVDPSKKVSICVINQDQLDNGEILFEETQQGKYSKRIIFKNDKHVNHYIALKKHPSDKDDEPVKALLVAHLKELPPNITFERDVEHSDHEDHHEDHEDVENNRVDEYENNFLNPEISNENRNELKKKLIQLRDNDEYKKMPMMNSNEIGRDLNVMNNINNRNNMNNTNEEYKEYKETVKEVNNYFNAYTGIGFICILIFAYIFYIKKIKK
jgi:hypothetical protein